MTTKISFFRIAAAIPIARAIVIFIVIVICGFGMSRGQSMSPVWLGPYLSAAANLEIGGEFLVDINQVMYFKELDKKDLARYSFSKSPDASETDESETQSDCWPLRSPGSDAGWLRP